MDLRKSKINNTGLENIELDNKEMNYIMEMLENFPGGVIRYSGDKDNHINLITDNMLRILECNREQFNEKYKNKMINIIVTEYINKFDIFVLSARNHENFDVKIETFNGEDKWVSVNINKVYDKDGKEEIYCIFMDINEYKQSSEECILENEMFKKILNGKSDIMFEYDIKKDAIIFNNIKYNTKKTESTNIPDCIDYIINSKMICEEDKPKIFSLLSMEKTEEIEFRFISIDGTVMWCSVRALAIKNKKGKNKKIIGWINNIDEQKKHEQYVHEQKLRDPLTKLYNQKAVKNMIDNHLHNEGNDQINAMVIIDIDNFTAINEKVGEVFGDAILINIANNIRKELRNDDLIARVGGDKYLIFLKDIENEKQVVGCVKRIQEMIQNTAIGDIKSLHVTSSIGVTIYPKDGKNFEKLFKNTDNALYYAKVYGKNRYEMFDKANMKSAGKDSYYNDYEEGIIKSEYESFEQEITSTFLDIMSKAHNIKEGINETLEMIGKKFRVSNVNILEVKKNRVNITYNWSNNGVIHEEETLNIKIDAEYIDTINGVLDNNGQLVINNYNNIEEKFFAKWLFDKYGIKSAVISTMKENDVIHGAITVSDVKCTHAWSESECKAIKTISMLLSSYLIKIRDNETMEDRIKEVANNDMLTGLPTIFNFKMEARNIIKKDKEKKYVICNIDFKKFKYINDNYGYEIGDYILKEFANIINKKDYGIVACCRYFSDNFLLLQEYESDEKIKLYLDLLNEHFESKIKDYNAKIKLGLSIGVCVIENNYGDIMGPIDNSNIARRYAKELNSVVHFFDDDMKNRLRMEFEITNSMEMALAHNEFKVYYQPKVNISDGTIAGAEALVRWVKPDDSVLGPDSFIPLFEKNGFVVNLDYFVYEEVCKMIREWMDEGKKVIPISVNVSRVHLYEEQGFIRDVISIVDKYNIPHELIELELTENMFVDNTEAALLTMKTLKNEGFKVSIDDFGSGYSSLNLLKDMTSDVLKLDRAFFSRDELRKEEQIIVSSIVDMAKKLDIKVLSEGVETKQQSDFLKEIHCDLAQGFLFSKPIPRDELEKMLNEENN